jgi:hypothetical protein
VAARGEAARGRRRRAKEGVGKEDGVSRRPASRAAAEEDGAGGEAPR